jgi:hypothetical protein
MYINNLDKLIFISKNQPNDLKVGCFLPFNLKELMIILKNNYTSMKVNLSKKNLWTYNF